MILPRHALLLLSLASGLLLFGGCGNLSSDGEGASGERGGETAVPDGSGPSRSEGSEPPAESEVTRSEATGSGEAGEAESGDPASEPGPGEELAETETVEGYTRPSVFERRRGVPYIPPIPEAELPERTRAPPDPEKDRVLREKVHVSLVEKIRPMKGGEHEAEVPVVEMYLEEYFRRAGHPIASSPEEARYRIEGTVIADFYDLLVFREQLIGWKYTGTATVRLLDSEGKVLREIEIPDLPRESIKDEETCILDLRRYLAKRLHDELFFEEGVFGRPDILELFEALVRDPLETGSSLTGEEIVDRLADIGLPAVPYLLEALTDERTVQVPYDYPGLEDPSRLKVYHVADKALEEIFQKVSRMNLDRDVDERYAVILGWENEWRRFCKPFRESPHRRPAPGSSGGSSRASSAERERSPAPGER